jgi:hypothetical protein
MLTQEFLAQMLSVRPPSVSIAAGPLQKAGHQVEFRTATLCVAPCCNVCAIAPVQYSLKIVSSGKPDARKNARKDREIYRSRMSQSGAPRTRLL